MAPVHTDAVVKTAVDGPVATVTLNRPDQLNALTPGMLELLASSLERLAASDEIRLVVLGGAGRAFCAGVDLKSLGDRSLEGGAVGEVLDGPARRAIGQIVTMDKLVVARVHGYCFTGALELALACDLIVAAEDTKFSDTHARFGLRPTWGMSQRLPQMVGVARARELSYTGRTFSAAEAASFGLVARTAPSAELDEVLDALSAEILKNSQGSLLAYKDLYRHALEGGLSEGLAYEASATYPITDTEARVADFR